MSPSNSRRSPRLNKHTPGPMEILMNPDPFAESEREAVYRAIEARRDVRLFRSEPIPPAVLWRILGAAHHAPSVGFMQPWNFILIRSHETRQRIHALFLEQNQSEL